MKATLTPISPYEYNSSDAPAYEIVFIPTLVAAIDDTNAATEVTATTDIDGEIHYVIYTSEETAATNAETLLADDGLVTITATEDIEETISLAGLDAGDYTIVLVAENDYDDASALVTLTFTVE